MLGKTFLSDSRVLFLPSLFSLSSLISSGEKRKMIWECGICSNNEAGLLSESQWTMSSIFRTVILILYLNGFKGNGDVKCRLVFRWECLTRLIVVSFTRAAHCCLLSLRRVLELVFVKFLNETWGIMNRKVFTYCNAVYESLKQIQVDWANFWPCDDCHKVAWFSP